MLYEITIIANTARYTQMVGVPAPSYLAQFHGIFASIEFQLGMNGLDPMEVQ